MQITNKIINFKGYNFAPQSNIEKDNGDVEVAFLTTNDSHGRIGKLPKLKTARDEFKSAFKDTDTADFVVSTGDNVMGLDTKKHDIWIDFLNKHLKPDVMVMGNHEFDKGGNYLGKVLQRMKKPTLAANIDVHANELMKKAQEEGKLLKSKIIVNKGVKIGLIGTTTPEVHVFKSKNEMQGVQVRDFEKTKIDIQKEVHKLEDKGVNKIILLSHMGYTADAVLAGSFEKSKTPEDDLKKLQRQTILTGIENLDGIRGVDVIIGGHSHDSITGAKKLTRISTKNVTTKLSNPRIKKFNLIQPEGKDPVLITQAGENTDYIGFIDLIFDKKGVIKTNTIINKNISVDRFKQNIKLKKEMEDNLGRREKLFTLSEPFIDPKRVSENAVQNMIADGMLEKANKELPNDNKADIALVHGAMARGSLKGKVSNWDLNYDIVPFKEPIYMIKLSEKQLVETLNNGARRTFYDNQRPVLMHTSANLKYEITKKPNNKDDLLFVNNVVLNGKSIDVHNPSEEKNINTLVEEYLMIGEPDKGGKEGFRHLCVDKSSDYIAGKIKHKPKDIIEEFDWSDKEALIQYASSNYKGETIKLEPEGRINILEDNVSFGALTHKVS